MEKEFKRKYMTITETKKLVVQTSAPDNEGKVEVMDQGTGKKFFLNVDEIVDIKKNMGDGKLSVYYCGMYTDAKGVTWECYTPIGNTLSSRVRLEHPTKKTRFMYDPGNHIRKTFADRIN